MHIDTAQVRKIITQCFMLVHNFQCHLVLKLYAIPDSIVIEKKDDSYIIIVYHWVGRKYEMSVFNDTKYDI